VQHYKVQSFLIDGRGRHDERFYNRADMQTVHSLLQFDRTQIYLLGNILESIGTGTGIAKTDQGFGEIAYVKVGNMARYRINFNETEVVTPEVVKRYKMPLLRPNDLLISRVGTVGNVCMYFEGDQPATPSDNVLLVRLRDDERLRPFYVCIFLNSPLGQAQIRRLTKQSLQEVVNQTSIESLVIPAPDPELQKQVEDDVLERLKRIDDLKARIELEISTAGETANNCLFPNGLEDVPDLELADIMGGVDTLISTANGNSSRKKRNPKHGDVKGSKSLFDVPAEKVSILTAFKTFRQKKTRGSKD
jgi:hypothetical protein